MVADIGNRKSRPSKIIIFISLILFVSLASQATVSLGQEKPQQPSQPAVPPTAEPAGPDILVSPDEDYIIGARDVIEIQVQDAPELSGRYPVGSNGKFLMPYLGFITAKDRSPQKLGELIADNLRGRYLKEPRVSVTVAQYNSRTFFIQGAVRSPGVFRLEGRASLLKLIILAGGLADNHGSTAFIIRELKSGPVKEKPAPEKGEALVADKDDDRSSPADGQSKAIESETGEEYQLLKVNISGLLKGHFDQNVLIEPGDVVNIPQTDVFFVAGEVEAPGSFPVKEGTTLRQAISLARGTTFEAAKNQGIIFRDDPETGKREEIAVDIGAVMSGKRSDIPIMANDIIMVPNSRFKSVGGTLLRALGMNTLSRGMVR